MNMMKRMQPSDLHKGPIRHPILPEGFIDRVRRFKGILSDVDRTTLEEAIDNFKRYRHPEEELAIWERIANTYQLFLSRNPTTDLAIKKEIFGFFSVRRWGRMIGATSRCWRATKSTISFFNYRGL